MRTTLVVILCLVLVGCSSADKDKKGNNVRLQFVPSSGTSKGASFSRFMQFGPGASDHLTVLAHAGIGDTFPVADKDKDKVFDVHVKDGDDTHLVLEVISNEGTKTLDVTRDKPVPVDIGGIQYKVTFPSVWVAASSNAETTSQATIFVTKPKE